jgi:hypothetical protein
LPPSTRAMVHPFSFPCLPVVCADNKKAFNANGAPIGAKSAYECPSSRCLALWCFTSYICLVWFGFPQSGGPVHIFLSALLHSLLTIRFRPEGSWCIRCHLVSQRILSTPYSPSRWQ